MTHLTEAKIALVSGASRMNGLGFHTALSLGKIGYNVMPTARTEIERTRLLDAFNHHGVQAIPAILNTTQTRSVEQLAAFIDRTFGKLDVLINNAAINPDLKNRGLLPSETPLEDFKQSLEVNVLGTIRLTQRLLPLLMKSKEARIVNVSSIAGSVGALASPGSNELAKKFPSYSISKAALNVWTLQLAQELQGSSVKVNSAHPGWTRTDMGGQDAPLSVEEGVETIVRLATLSKDGPTGGFFHLDMRLAW
jgi:NAD(P)-dependent dehydrogenase (short-subunit alcohol dehydrogenase family)